MGVNKRYYWLKLKEDFFTDKRIKRLRRLAGGDTYTIIYQKLLLLSLRDSGMLYFDGVVDDFIDELALTIDEKVDDIQVTISFLKQQNLLLEVKEGEEFYLSEMEELIGSETASTVRSRVSRDRAKKLREQLALQCNTNATPMQHHCNNTQHDCNNLQHHCNNMQQYCNGEIEIEKELEIEKDIECGCTSKIKSNTKTKTNKQTNKFKTNNNINNNIYNQKTPTHLEPGLGEFENVFLTENEQERLKAKFGVHYQSMIERLSSYMAGFGKGYDNHYAVLLRWYEEDKKKLENSEPKKAKNGLKDNRYSHDDLQKLLAQKQEIDLKMVMKNNK